MKFLSIVALVALPAFAAAVAVPLELQERTCKGPGTLCSGEYECCPNLDCVQIICNDVQYFCEPKNAAPCINKPSRHPPTQ
ncbi:hypothetical protein HBI56_105040 [Parastagonospora nodorum]|nr:hypothetical protein HBI10_163880 [Parastagonospora nodorum]KAH4021622.1 hypothetical protein HBI13_105110 [Parastagonospora nodorum]KAH4030371.1 hypothetical protein HBI09_128600 [Parastagonospora nodorum]KAH4169771.1 hypothetical protein HBH43_110600 [Parastagonospora nodorum]KAH4416032.1 hypothetical protein HBH92_067420 [Parastagonospora nodorum]